AAARRRRGQRERMGDAEWARKQVEAAAAARAASQREQPFAVKLSFLECDSRHPFGTGGDPPKFLTAATALAMTLAKGQGRVWRGGDPGGGKNSLGVARGILPESLLLESLRRDRLRRVTIALDRVTTVVSPGGLLLIAQRGHALPSVARQAATEGVREWGVEA
ncbi:unnamed protein product, partial [Discosporangium mesarthrocarpum]